MKDGSGEQRERGVLSFPFGVLAPLKSTGRLYCSRATRVRQLTFSLYCLSLTITDYSDVFTT